jgi:hypothetical protein
LSKQYIEKKELSIVLTPLVYVGKLVKNPKSYKSIVRARSLKPSEFPQIYHLYNCEYVKDFLTASGVPDDKMHYLCGPLENSFLHLKYSDIAPFKKNFVAYNPAKIDQKFLYNIKNIFLLRTKISSLSPFKI